MRMTVRVKAKRHAETSLQHPVRGCRFHSSPKTGLMESEKNDYRANAAGVAFVVGECGRDAPKPDRRAQCAPQ